MPNKAEMKIPFSFPPSRANYKQSLKFLFGLNESKLLFIPLLANYSI